VVRFLTTDDIRLNPIDADDPEVCLLSHLLYPPQTKFEGLYRKQLLLSDLLDFCETLHICSTLPADVHEGIWLLSKI
jgi:hypothetical protein